MTPSRRIHALLEREWATLFGTPLVWTIAAVFALFAGIVQFLVGLRSGDPASVSSAGGAVAWCMLLLAPALAVRSAVEDSRTGYWEVLAASPARTWEIAAARWIAATAAVCVAILAALAGPAIAIGCVSSIDWGEFIAIVVGLFGVGIALVATGLLAGTLSGSAPVAAFIASVVWIALVVAGQVMPQIVGPDWAPVAFAADPMRRLARALGGVVDSADLLTFLWMSLCLVGCSVIALHVKRYASRRQLLDRLSATLAMVACLVIGVSLADLSSDPRVAVREPLSRSPSAPLADATRAAILANHDAIVTLIRPARAPLPAAEELLNKVSAAGLMTRVFDPDDLSNETYLAWLDDLSKRESQLTNAYQLAIADGFKEVDAIARIGREVSSEISSQSTTHPDTASRLASLAGALQQFSEVAPVARANIEERMAQSPAQPFGDQEGAARMLRDALEVWAVRLSEGGRLVRSNAPSDDARSIAVARVLEGTSLRVQKTVDALRMLRPRRMDALTRALVDGQALVVQQGEQLLAWPGWMVAGEGLDARGRTEEIVLRALAEDPSAMMAHAIIIHAEGRSVLRASASGADLRAVADALAAARFEVHEWSLASTQSEPNWDGETRRVWWIIPPLTRNAIDPDRSEKDLIAAANRLLDRGESVILSVSPSLLAVAGQLDPWAQLSTRLGVDAHTDRMVLDDIAIDEGRVESLSDQTFDRADREHAIGLAVDGLRIHLPSVAPLRESLFAIDPFPLLHLEPDPSRRVARDWRGARAGRRWSDDEAVSDLDKGAFAVMTPEGGRAVIVGCPDWMLTAVARRPAAGADGRAMLHAPGNLAFAVAASTWASGGDPSSVAGASAAQRLARIPPLTQTQRVMLGVLLICIVPGTLVFSGISIDRRRRLT
ncbi:MAG: ABC transporter permease [Planctomycetota bacterium]|nr:ABC transporter permease [Planctomycetota bacterium]